MARETIAAVSARGRVADPGRWLRALPARGPGRARLPGTDPARPGRARGRAGPDGPAELHARLAAVDPAAAASILPSNGRRIVRALEVVELTGRPFSATLPRHESCTRRCRSGCRSAATSSTSASRVRVAQMWRAGLVDEVRGLAQAGLARGPDRQPGARLRAGAAGPGRGVGRGRGPRADRQGDPAVCPAPGHLVPPRPAGDLAGRRSRRGPACPGTGYDRAMPIRPGAAHRTPVHRARIYGRAVRQGPRHRERLRDRP